MTWAMSAPRPLGPEKAGMATGSGLTAPLSMSISIWARATDGAKAVMDSARTAAVAKLARGPVKTDFRFMLGVLPIAPRKRRAP
jgi:hypothetical protein